MTLLLVRLLNSLRSLIAGVREGREIARRYEALTRLSDRQLASVGLDRAELPQAAVAGH